MERGKKCFSNPLIWKSDNVTSHKSTVVFHNKIIWCSMYNIESLSQAFDMSYVEYALSKS